VIPPRSAAKFAVCPDVLFDGGMLIDDSGVDGFEIDSLCIGGVAQPLPSKRVVDYRSGLRVKVTCEVSGMVELSVRNLTDRPLSFSMRLEGFALYSK
jgi:hypothetical protein